MTNALHSLLGIIALVLFWKFCWKRYALDKFRQDIFTERNKLFELSLDNPEIFSFEHPIYNKVWDQMNGLIHFGYLMSADFLLLNHFALKIRVNGKTGNEVLKDLGHLSMKTIEDAQVRKDIAEMQRRVNVSIFRYLVTTSPLFIAFTLLVFTGAFISAVQHLAFHGLKKITEDKMKPAIDLVKSHAIEIERLHSEHPCAA